MLFTVWPETGGMHMWVSADAFEQFFPEISADEARRHVGPDGEERLLDQTAIREFIAGLERLLHPTPEQEAPRGLTPGCRKTPPPARPRRDGHTIAVRLKRQSGRREGAVRSLAEHIEVLPAPFPIVLSDRTGFC